MTDAPSELAQRLGDQAEAVCRHYLSNGRREGGYWLVGDVRNTPGRSMYVRLKGSTKSAAGKWTDAASGEHGDLLDVIRETCGFAAFREVAEEARRFLALPRTEPLAGSRPPASRSSVDAARRLWAMTKPLAGSLAETYLRGRGISRLKDCQSLRFHPRCRYRHDRLAPMMTWPAMIGAVTDLNGEMTGVHRTWLASNGSGKAPIDTPRRALGDLLGHAVRFGGACDVLAVGEGVETILSLRCALPALPMAAALSASHLAALELPRALRRLYIAKDDDRAGEAAATALAQRARNAGIEVLVICPERDDFNDDLRRFGIDRLRATVRGQIVATDAARFVVEAS